MPKRVAAREVRGRRSGRVISFPVAIAHLEGQRYLVSMLGKNANWVRNLKPPTAGRCCAMAAARACTWRKLPPSLRAPILQRYLQVAPGARAHIPVDRRASLAGFAQIAPDYPVFRVHADAA